MKWLLRQMCGHGHINSIEVAVLCLLQKIMNDNAWSSKTSRKIHARANIFKSLPPKLVLYSRGPSHTQHSGPHSPSQKNYKILIIIK